MSLSVVRVGKFLVHSLHSKLSQEYQDKALVDPGYESWVDHLGRTFDRSIRKIVSATNISEASVTIQDLGYVIDTGLSKRLAFDWKTRQKLLIIDAIHQHSVIQWKSRAGRTRRRTFYRM